MSLHRVKNIYHILEFLTFRHEGVVRSIWKKMKTLAKCGIIIIWLGSSRNSFNELWAARKENPFVNHHLQHDMDLSYTYTTMVFSVLVYTEILSLILQTCHKENTQMVLRELID